MARPRSASPMTYSWSSSLDDDDDEDGDGNWGAVDEDIEIPYRPATAGSLGARARTPHSGISRGANTGSRPGTPFISASPPPIKIKILKNRDKESLYDEIMHLSQAINDRNLLIRKQKVHASKLSVQNRRLEKNVDNLEMVGIKAPRTGAPSRLRAIVQGLRLKLRKFEALYASQEDEIYQLERDLRVTNSREIQVERDVYAGELGRLQEVIKTLKKSKQRLKNENKEIHHTKEKIKILEQANDRLEFSIQAVQGSVDKANQEMEASKQAAESSLQEAREMARLYNRIQEHKVRLEQLVDREKTSKEKLGKRVTNLSAMITKTEKQLYELARKGVPIPGLKLRGGGPEQSVSHSEMAHRVVSPLLNECSQASVPSAPPRCPTPMLQRSSSPAVPKLNLERLKQRHEQEKPASPVEKAPTKTPAAADEDRISMVSKSSKSSRSSKSSKKKKKKKKKKKLVSSPVQFIRPPSRMAFRSEGSGSSTNNNVRGMATSSQVVVATSTSLGVAPTGGDNRAAGSVEEHAYVQIQVHEVQRLRGGSRKLETVCENQEQDHAKKPSIKQGERREKVRSGATSTSTGSYLSSHPKIRPSMQRMREARSLRDQDCLEWLQTLEVPDAGEDRAEETSSSGLPRPPSRTQPKLNVVYAEDTLQMTQLSRPAFAFLPSRPGDRFVRWRYPP